MDHRFFYCGIIILIILILIAPKNAVQPSDKAIGAGGLSMNDPRFPPGNTMSADLNSLFRRKWGVTAY